MLSDSHVRVDDSDSDSNDEPMGPLSMLCPSIITKSSNSLCWSPFSLRERFKVRS